MNYGNFSLSPQLDIIADIVKESVMSTIYPIIIKILLNYLELELGKKLKIDFF